MALSLLAPPGGEPVTIEEFKEHIRVDHNAEDVALAGFLTAARQAVEARGALALMAQQWRFTIDEVPQDIITLPIGPVLSVDAITIVDNQGVAQNLDADAYDVAIGALGRITPHAPGFAPWPMPGVKIDGVRIDFTAGWASIALIPPALKQAIKLLAAHFYEAREAASPIRAQTIPGGVDALIAPYKRVRV